MRVREPDDPEYLGEPVGSSFPATARGARPGGAGRARVAGAYRCGLLEPPAVPVPEPLPIFLARSRRDVADGAGASSEGCDPRKCPHTPKPF